ncbi:hypothetical protein N7447_009181 [Penicillium robsamsonii]|uniref:uncharacterized protein n=1 Tax=Penicillium robsamsonii TaxID=1792511 RepID=UPI002548752F|nr:uncharacterized protein N7447_009181 [Penicillium robsamsonii]KAJ5816948.1 hypothetical protein N7447_009181 [Penicillium robsamsonii]
MAEGPTTPNSPHSVSWFSERTLSVSTAVDPPSPSNCSVTPLDLTDSPIPIEYRTITFRESPNFHPHFLPLLRHLAAQLWPLVNCETGLPHPDFPPNMLAYNLLTSAQVDNLARHFHQVYPPIPATFNYPICITPWIGTPEEKTLDLPTRLKRLGRFFGLRGCEEDVDMDADHVDHVDHENENGNEMRESDEVLQQMELEWQQALQRAYAEESHRWNLK